MNSSAWLWFLPLSMLPFASPGRSLHIHRPSHVILRGDLDREAAQALMDERLGELREMHRLQDDVQKLALDPNLRENIRKNFSPEDLRKLRDKILKGGGLSGDQSWQKLLQQLGKGQKLDEQNLRVLHRWAEKEDEKRRNGGTQRSESAEPPSIRATDRVIRPSDQPSFGPSEPGGSAWEQFQDQAKEFFADHAGEFAGDIAAALAEANNKDEAAPLAELFRQIKNTDLSQMQLSEFAGQWADRVPNLGRFLREQSRLMDGMRSLVRNSPPSSLPAAVGPPSTDGSDVNGTIMALLVLGVLYVLVWRMVASASGRTKAIGLVSVCRPTRAALLGVATREDLVRLFEQLALFRLGSAAGVCNHRELAGRLAEHEFDGDAARRRQAADLLAWRYEQARYDRLAEPLSPEEWSEVRHALGFLAGVTTA